MYEDNQRSGFGEIQKTHPTLITGTGFYTDAY